MFERTIMGETSLINYESPPLVEVEPEPHVWRGTFGPAYDRKVLFSQEVVVKTADLPRWQPLVTIDRRTLERQTEND